MKRTKQRAPQVCSLWGETVTVARSPLQMLKEAKQIAKDHGCFVVEKNGKYLVYRKTPTRNVYLGSRGSPGALRALVCAVTGFQ